MAIFLAAGLAIGPAAAIDWEFRLDIRRAVTMKNRGCYTSCSTASIKAAPRCIEGGQIPSWGGCDYFRLAGSVDATELYDFGYNVELVRSFGEVTVLAVSGRYG